MSNHYKEGGISISELIPARWLVILSALFLVFCFYFTLTFFEYLREDDRRIIRQAKTGAIACLAIAFLIAIVLLIQIT